MKRENYRILIIHQDSQDLVLARERLKTDFPNAEISNVRQWKELINIFESRTFDIAILYCNLSWAKQEDIINFLSSPKLRVPIFTFVERDKFEDIKYLLELGVKDYSLSNAKFSYRLPIAIKSIIENYRENLKTREMEDKLAMQEIMFKTLFESAPEAIALTSEDGTVIEINPMFTQIFGFTPQELK